MWGRHMHAFTQMIFTHPAASIWLAAIMWFWIATYASTGGVWRNRRRQYEADPTSDRA